MSRREYFERLIADVEAIIAASPGSIPPDDLANIREELEAFEPGVALYAVANCIEYTGVIPARETLALGLACARTMGMHEVAEQFERLLETGSAASGSAGRETEERD